MGGNDGRWGDRCTGSEPQDAEIAKCFFEQDGERIPVGCIPSASPMMSNSRKRAAHPSDHDHHSSADESAPIIRHTASGQKDYQSISPSINARMAGAEVDAGPAGRTKEVQQRETAEREAVQQEEQDNGWRKWVEKYGSVELENKGSVARDHLALERTFLAWLRTSLSFASIGIAVTQLFRLNTTISDPSSSPNGSPQARLRHVGKPLGATFIAISILILFIGFHRYFEAQHYVIRGKFPASRGSIVLVSLVAGGLIVSSLVVILAVAPRAFEK